MPNYSWFWIQHRRMKIAERIDALGELFSCSKQVTHPIGIWRCVYHIAIENTRYADFVKVMDVKVEFKK